MSLFQAEKLIDLACSTTHEEEARTAALTACKLIRKHGLRLTLGDPQRASGGSTANVRRATQRVRDKPPNGGVFRRAAHARRCDNCGDSISAGDTVYVVAEATWCERH